MSDFKIYNGVDFVDSELFVCNGSDFIKTEMYKSNSNDWERVDYAPKLRTKTWVATWSQSYLGNNKKRDTNVLYQGQAQSGTYKGSQRSLIGFNTSDIMQELKGSTIQKVEFEFYSVHSWYSTGCTYKIGFHNHSNKPTAFSISEPNLKSIKCNRNTKIKVDLTSLKLGEKLRNGSAKGLAFYVGNNTNLVHYGYVNGASLPNPPKITITYIK